jgi:uncharacterized protein DUF4154
MRRRSAAVLVAITLGCLAQAGLRASDSPEYDVKAAFLFNFAKFVEWPPSSFAGPEAPLAICVLGHDPFGTTLDNVVRGESANDRVIAVDRPQNATAARSCQILFVSASEQPRFAEILRTIDRSRTLTVSDVPGFLEAGGALRFFLAGNHVRFEINAAATERAQFRVSSKLMRVARVTRPGSGSRE